MTAGIILILAALGTLPTSRPPLRPSAAHTPEAVIAAWLKQTVPPRPRVSVSLDAESPYQRGEPARVYMEGEEDAYVTVVRIDTDGRLRLLFPLDPWQDNWVQAGRRFEVLGRERDAAFEVSDYPGVGYVFAVASPDPFDFGGITRGDHWDYRAIADDGRVRGDPYVAISDLADRIVPGGEYDYDVAEYYVEQHYDYPRFACYDCHSYTHWTHWDPYASYCASFRIVIYDDWYYYPYHYYPYYPAYYPYYQPYPYPAPGPYYRPYNPGPRYVFKDRAPGTDYVSRVTYREREDPVDRRSARTGADVGGRGSVPAPTTNRMRGQSSGTAASPAPAEGRRTVSPRSGEPAERSATPSRRSREETRPQGAGSSSGTSPEAIASRRGSMRSAEPSSSAGRSPPRAGDSGWGRRPTPRDGGGPGAARTGGDQAERRGQAPRASGSDPQSSRAAKAPSRSGGDRGAGAKSRSGSSGGGSSRGSQPELRRRTP